MTDPRILSIKDFTYSLPEDRIAKYPLKERDASKLLVYKKKTITEDIYKNIAANIPTDSLLIFNDTKVVEARLLFQKPSGGVIEIFCLEPHEHYKDITIAMLQKEKVFWKCLVGGASKWKHGQVLEKKISGLSTEFILKAKYIEKAADSFVIELAWNNSSLSFAEVLHLAGAIPLPPYIKRDADKNDTERYQTIYANHDGSVAAPTAGLHFTTHVFEKLKEKNIHHDFVTLHVGAGTFKPVKSDTMEQHQMHAEYFNVSKQTILNILDHLDKNIIAVGTTTLRTLESLYWMGLAKQGIENLPVRQAGWESGISQWTPYEERNLNIPTKDALSFLLEWMEKNNLESIVSKTQIIIAPGYKFKIVKGLVTNFHQPQSTLLLLVAAFAENNPIAIGWKKIYDYALENEFRFLSYGDGCLLWLNQP